jgi:hypothetical protein
MLPESTSSPHGGRSLQRLRVRRLELIGRYPSANRSFHERGGHMGPRAGPATGFDPKRTVRAPQRSDPPLGCAERLRIAPVHAA